MHCDDAQKAQLIPLLRLLRTMIGELKSDDYNLGFFLLLLSTVIIRALGEEISVTYLRKGIKVCSSYTIRYSTNLI